MSTVDRLRADAVRAPDAVLDRLAAIRGTRDVASYVAACHTASIAHAERGDAHSALVQARSGLAMARRAGLTEYLPEFQFVLAWLDLERGASVACLARLAAVREALGGAEPARARCLRGLSLSTRGRHADAVVEFSAAIGQLADDPWWRANALTGRGVALGYRGRCDDALADLAAARALWQELGQPRRAAACLHNSGYAALLAGDVPRALALFDAAAEAGVDSTLWPESLVDRAEALQLAGLVRPAMDALQRAWNTLLSCGREAKAAEARLSLARCALRAGEPEIGFEAATQAWRLFRDQRRPAWAALARAVRAQAALGTGCPRALTGVVRTARECASHGWYLASAELRVAGAVAAIRAGRAPMARRLLAETTTRTATVLERLVAWRAKATLARLAGERARVLRAARNGLRLLIEELPMLGAYETPALLTEIARELTSLALDQLLHGERIDTTSVLRWAEWQRVGSSVPARSWPDDPELATALAALRAAVVETKTGTGRGSTRAVQRCEQRVRRRVLATPALRARWEPLSTRALRERLGRAVLLLFFTHRDVLYRVSFMDGKAQVRSMGTRASVSKQVHALWFFLAHPAFGRQGSLCDAVASAGEKLARDLEALLLAGLGERLGDRPFVIVPSAPLQDLSWSALPTCRSRAISVAPTVTSWLCAADPPTRCPQTERSIWVCGPRLPGANKETRDLYQRYGGILCTPPESTVDSVLRLAEGADVLHLAAHGRFRADQPLFSSIDLVDGPLHAYDLRRLRNPPRLVVLSACEAGATGIGHGEDLLGLASALLAAGTRTLIASVLPVPDDRAPRLMSRLHQELRSGRSPAAALAAAQAVHGHLGFQCFGDGVSAAASSDG
ncbi:CHAT domain-containing protein [Longimycelium tulufanense]|uniref:CHAT domain-containing protein n=1 Tax=Longimycelium tulufanense TaxID=907463 RepID=UPI00166E7953|nr:CHAT domain-containing protein [Longimycelium tulufanense]